VFSIGRFAFSAHFLSANLLKNLPD